MHRTHAGHGSIWPSEAVEARASDQSTLTPERIAELRALLAKATPGPWAVGKHKSDVGVAGEDFGAGYPARAGTVASLYDGEYIKNPRSVEDAALIVAMRNALPALLDRLEKAEGELAEAREDVRSLCRFILNEWGPDGALKATTFALEQRQSAKGGDANAAPDRDTNSKSATSPGVTAGASAGWRPIETAPVDLPVLLYCPNLGVANPERIELGTAHTSRGSHHAWATMWMPLPAAPVDGGKDA